MCVKVFDRDYYFDSLFEDFGYYTSNLVIGKSLLFLLLSCLARCV